LKGVLTTDDSYAVDHAMKFTRFLPLFCILQAIKKREEWAMRLESVPRLLQEEQVSPAVAQSAIVSVPFVFFVPIRKVCIKQLLTPLYELIGDNDSNTIISFCSLSSFSWLVKI